MRLRRIYPIYNPSLAPGFSKPVLKRPFRSSQSFDLAQDKVAWRGHFLPRRNLGEDRSPHKSCAMPGKNARVQARRLLRRLEPDVRCSGFS